MKAKDSFIAGSLAHCGSVGSLMYCIEIRPTDLSRPAGLSTEPTLADTWFR